MTQLSLFNDSKRFSYVLGKNDFIPKKVSFRDIVPEITSTTYSTHSIYYYPAKFIPQVVRFCIKEFTNEKDLIIDPFAGSGTVGLEAFLMKRNSILLDLNYLLKYIIPIKIYQGNSFSKNILIEKIIEIQNCSNSFIPEYSNIRYWYPEEMFEVISHYWAGLNKLEENIYKWIIQASLIKLSKQFSLAEHRTPKLFISKFKRKYISELLQNNWKQDLDDKLIKYSLKYYNSVNQFRNFTKGFNNDVKYFAGIDSSKFKLDNVEGIDALITSPPYLQAQEYIRTSKLDLFWLGYNESQIRGISRMEIPYRKADRIIETETLNKIRGQVERKKLIKILDSYFDHTIASLENNMNLLKKGGKACIFIGNPTIDGIEIETWRIFTEYFTAKNFKFEIVFDDEIKTRQLFGSRNNKNPNGMKSEYLLILTKL